ncbi:MAG: alpha/beta fold hydrolase [Mycobacteriales bacterium]
MTRRDAGAVVGTAGSDPDTMDVRVLGNRVRVSHHRGSADLPPVLLCMGLGGWLELWTPLRHRLHAAGLTTVAFDAPGTGGSRTPLLPLPLGGHALVALGVLDRLGIGRASVVGLSWGGLLAQHLAITAPRRISRVVLVSTNVGLGSLPGSLRGLRDSLSGSADRPGRLAERRDSPWRRRGADIARLYQVASLAGWSSLPLLPWLRQPTLVMAGDRDHTAPLVNSRIIACAAPHARLHVIPGGGHTVLLERPDEVTPVISDFLAAG